MLWDRSRESGLRRMGRGKRRGHSTPAFVAHKSGNSGGLREIKVLCPRLSLREIKELCPRRSPAGTFREYDSNAMRGRP